MWNDFNHGWLALLQKQKDLTESEQKLEVAQSLISKDGLEDMGKELVRLCDGIEKHGLVDYEYGVWEERIIAGKFFRRTLVKWSRGMYANLTGYSSHGLSRPLRIGR